MTNNSKIYGQCHNSNSKSRICVNPFHYSITKDEDGHVTKYLKEIEKNKTENDDLQEEDEGKSAPWLRKFTKEEILKPIKISVISERKSAEVRVSGRPRSGLDI